MLSVISLQWDNFLFLVRQLVERGILGEEEVVSHWRKLSQLPWPTVIVFLKHVCVLCTVWNRKSVVLIVIIVQK